MATIRLLMKHREDINIQTQEEDQRTVQASLTRAVDAANSPIYCTDKIRNKIKFNEDIADGLFYV